MTSSTPTRDYRPDIDGLRALAVLPVVFYHAGVAGFSGGFVGVDIFFVISGFLITRIIFQEMEDSRFTFAGFYLRRVRRLFPALFALLIAVSLAGLILLIPTDLIALGDSITSTIVFRSNILFYKQGGYFSLPAIDKPLLHTWSLSVEEQFYLFWPLLLLLLRAVLKPESVVLAVWLLFLASFTASALRLETHPVDVFFLFKYRAWELLMGGLIALYRQPRLPSILANCLSTTGLALIVGSVAGLDASTPFPGPMALLPCAGAALVIFVGQTGRPYPSRLLSLRPLRFIGLVSYSLYLVHWPTFSFAHICLAQPLTAAGKAIAIGASLILAILSWRFVEVPFRRQALPSIRLFTRAAVTAGALALVGIVFASTEGLRFRVNEGVQLAELAIRHAERSVPPAYCRREKSFPIPGNNCKLGDVDDGPYDFLVWGDSHALHYGQATGLLSAGRPMKGIVFSFWACPPFLNDKTLRHDCPERNDQVFLGSASIPI